MMDVIVAVGHFDEVIDMKARRYELTNKEWDLIQSLIPYRFCRW